MNFFSICCKETMYVARNKNIGNIFQVTSVRFTITNDFLTLAEYYQFEKSQKGYFYKISIINSKTQIRTPVTYKMSSVIQSCFVYDIFYTDKEGSKNFTWIYHGGYALHQLGWVFSCTLHRFLNGLVEFNLFLWLPQPFQ